MSLKKSKEHRPPSSPSKEHGIIDMDYNLEQSAWSLDQLKVAAIQLRLLRPRSLAWAILLQAVPPPDADIVSSIRSHRKQYDELKEKLSMDPHGVIGDDPLSQNDKSVWRQHFCDNELKALILQDVVRTFPDELFFREKDVQDLMVRVLFHWCRSHPVGYRQGMHEVLAPALAELHLDRRLCPNSAADTLKYILSEDHLEHDSYMLFSAIMSSVERFYTTGDTVPSPCGRMPHSTSMHNPTEVVRYLDKVREEYLVPLDSELATFLNSHNITMELFGIRWLRLLFGREFPRSEIPHLWGFLFAEGPSLPKLHYVIVAMLISIRKTLLGGGCGAALARLMRGAGARAGPVLALALHLAAPARHPRPPSPAAAPPDREESPEPSPAACSLDEAAAGAAGPGAAGAEGEGEVARALAALAAVRARLPRAAAGLRAALPRPPPAALPHLAALAQLAALLECRNHALIDVETALEAAEGDQSDQIGRRHILPVVVNHRPPTKSKPVNKVKEVPLMVFHQAECEAPSDLPCLDPLRLRTE